MIEGLDTEAKVKDHESGNIYVTGKLSMRSNWYATGRKGGVCDSRWVGAEFTTSQHLHIYVKSIIFHLFRVITTPFHTAMNFDTYILTPQ